MIMRLAAGLLMMGLVCFGGTTTAQTPSPVHSPEDFAQAMKDTPCPEGQARDNGGTCVAEIGTRGFNLGARTHSKPAQAAKPAKPSLLDDLSINFDSGSAKLTTEGEAEVKSFGIAMMMPWLAKRRFEIAGHTDASGSKRKNLALSQARADAVVEALVAQGVDRARLDAKGYGSDRLALPNAPRDPANRRVEARSLN